MSVTTVPVLRDGGLAELARMLEDQQTRKLDVVVPSLRLSAEDATLVVEGAEAQIGPDGVTATDGRYRLTGVAVEGLASRLGIPVGYLRRCAEERPDLFDGQVNGWLHGDGADAAPDRRKHLLRAFRGDEGGEGVARAVLSDTYRIIDHLDVLMAALDGVRAAGVEARPTRCDLSERRMLVKIEAPEVAVAAEQLLRNYRSPFTGEQGLDNPLVHAGFRISNSEVGGGAFSITPEVTIQVCRNGLTRTQDVLRAIHLGERMDTGVVAWSEDTTRKAIELVTAKTRDAVRTFLDAGYVSRVVDEVTEAADGPMRGTVEETVEHVAKQLRYTDEQRAGVLDHFIRGGDVSPGGVMAAVTSYAQEIEDPDVAWEFQSTGLDALVLARG